MRLSTLAPVAKPVHGSRGSRGFTLIELLVVVAIIAVLAGIMVTVYPSMLVRSQNTAWLANLKELDKAIPSFEAAHSGLFPNGFDSLVDSTGAIYTGLPEALTGGTNALIETRTLSAGQVAMLANSGITELQTMRDDHTAGFGATYFAYGNGLYTNPVTLDDTSTAVFLAQNTSGTYLFPPNKLLLDDTHDYMVVGVGQACELFEAGGWSKDCPVLVHNDGCSDPAEVYCRAYAIFDLGVSGSASSRSRAKFVGTVAGGAHGFKYSTEVLSVPTLLE